MSAVHPISAVGDIDTSALNGNISRAEVRAFRLWVKTTSAGSHHRSDVVSSLLVVIVVTFSIPLLVFGALLVVLVALGAPDRISGIFAAAIVGAFAAFGIVRMIDIWRRDVRFGVRWRRWMRMRKFAESNNYTYLPEIISPAYSGSMFTMGTVRRASDVMMSRLGRQIEVGNYRFSGTRALDRSLNQCGYIRAHVDRPLPHIYLRSRGSHKFGATFARFQEFELEGDFGKYFRLYAPGSYERDALYILTPDLMAMLIDEAADFDVEFIDRNVYFYSRRRFKMRDAATYSRANKLVDTVVSKALKQTRAYSDHRTVGDFVAVRGARLSRGLTITAVIGILYGVAQVIRIIYTLVVG